MSCCSSTPCFQKGFICYVSVSFTGTGTDVECGKKVLFFFFFFYQGFLSQPFTNHQTTGEGGGHFCNSSLPLPPASQTLRHQPDDYCRELTSAHRYQPDSSREPLVSERKLVTIFTHLTNVSFDDILNGLFKVMNKELLFPQCCFIASRYCLKQYSRQIVKSFKYAWNFVSPIWFLGQEVFRMPPVPITHMFPDRSRFLMSNTNNISLHLWLHSNINSVASF